MDQVVALTTLVVIAVSILFDWWYFSWLPSKRLPPGPTPWPFVGNMHQLRSTGADAMTAAAILQKKYGRIATFWIGKRPLIIVNDPVLVHDALVTQGAFFAERCKLSSQWTASKGFRTLNSTSGAQTSILRRNMMLNVLNPPSLKAYQPNRTDTIEDIVRSIRSATEASGGVAEVNFVSTARSSFFKHTLVMCLGVNVDEVMLQRVNQLMMERMRLNFLFYYGDYIPVWRIFELKNRWRLRTNQKECEKLFWPIIEKLRGMQGQDDVLRGNYCESLFQLQGKVGSETVDNDLITTLCCELINGAAHTISATIDAAINLLTDHPEVQKRLFDEIQATVGNRPVDESDLPNLPYLSAVAKEVLRTRPPATTTLAHATSELRKLGGYDIPTNAVILFGLKAVQQEPNLFPDPLVFKPERFLEKNLDSSGTRDFSFIPFGAGRRVCPASNLAFLELSMAVARLVQTFEWLRESVAEATAGFSFVDAFPRPLGPLLARAR